jgi:hypothetical protein
VSICSRSPGQGHSNRRTSSRAAAGILESPRRCRQRLTVACAIPSSDAISLGPHPVRCRASQTRSWTSSLTRAGWRCGVEGRSFAHWPPRRSSSLAYCHRATQYCTVDTLTRRQAAAWRRVNPCSKHNDTNS